MLTTSIPLAALMFGLLRSCHIGKTPAPERLEGECRLFLDCEFANELSGHRAQTKAVPRKTGSNDEPVDF